MAFYKHVTQGLAETTFPIVSLKMRDLDSFVPYSTHQPNLAINNFSLGLSLPNAFPVDGFPIVTQAGNNNQSLVATPQDQTPSFWVLILTGKRKRVKP